MFFSFMVDYIKFLLALAIYSKSIFTRGIKIILIN